MRVNKFLSQAGIASRREADQMIADGLVYVNGIQASLGKVLEIGDTLTLLAPKKQTKEDLSKKEAPESSSEITLIYTGEIKEKVYLAYNKPKGITCTCSNEDPTNIIKAVNFPTRIYPIGRLDKESQGLILLTNDGELTYKLSHPKFEHEKEYLVTVDRKIDEGFIQKMSSGIKLEEKKTSPCKVKKVSNNEFTIILHEGLNRQIRRMCENLGYTVVKLVRTRIAQLALEPETKTPNTGLKSSQDKHPKQKIKTLENHKIQYFSIPEGTYVKIYKDQLKDLFIHATS